MQIWRLKTYLIVIGVLFAVTSLCVVTVAMLHHKGPITRHEMVFIGTLLSICACASLLGGLLAWYGQRWKHYIIAQGLVAAVIFVFCGIMNWVSGRHGWSGFDFAVSVISAYQAISRIAKQRALAAKEQSDAK